MLQYRTIDSATLELLKKFQAVSEFKDMRLVGGTSLALQIGHRISIDLDFFGEHNLPEFKITNILSKIGETKLVHKTNSILVYSIDGIKVDIVNYPYKWIEQAIVEEDIILAGMKDIAAMKLSAVTGRGTKKDFIDIYFLLRNFSLPEQLELYSEKYPQGSQFMVLKSLSYFKDADLEKTPTMLIDVSWEDIKNRISKEVLNLNYK